MPRLLYVGPWHTLSWFHHFPAPSQNATSNGGDASRVRALRQGFTNRHVISAELLCLVYEPLLLCPTRDASPPLVLEFCGSVLYLRFVLAFSGNGTFTILQRLYLPSILHLTLTHRNTLTINALLSVRCYKFHLHASYTTHTLPHGTSTGGRHHSIGEQKSLLLRQIVLRPYAVLSTAHVQTDCAAAGCDV